MLSTIFDDDEHTARDGAYERFLKTRKWVYLSATYAILVGQGRIDVKALVDTLHGVVKIDAGLLWLSAAIPLTLLGSQAGLILLQTISTYDISIAERKKAISGRRYDARLTELNDAVANKYSEYISKLRYISSEYSEGEDFLRKLKVERVKHGETLAISIIRNVNILIIDEKYEYRKEKLESLLPILSALHKLTIERDSFSNSLSLNRPIFKYTEVAIDILRIFPPFVAMVAGWIYLLI